MSHTKEAQHGYERAVNQRGITAEVEEAVVLASGKQRTYEKTFTPENQYGLHVRPAALIARIGSDFDINVSARVNGKKVYAKSIIGLMTLQAGQGVPIIFEAVEILPHMSGQAEQYFERLQRLFERKFGED